MCPDALECPEFRLAPSNRFLTIGGWLYDRNTGGLYDAVPVEPWEWWGDLVGWGEGDDERLLLWHAGEHEPRFVVVDAALEPVAQFEEIPGRRADDHLSGRALNQRGRYVAAVVEGGAEFEFGDLGMTGSHTTATTATSPRPEGSDGQDEWLVAFDGGYAWTVSNWERACRLLRYSQAGTLLSDLPVPACWLNLSPDGSMFAYPPFETAVGRSAYGYHLPMAISIFDAGTGEELRRITGATSSDRSGRAWLADGAGIIVGTVRGDRLATLDGQWERIEGRPAPDDADILAMSGTGLLRSVPPEHVVYATEISVIDRDRRVLASLEFEPIDPPPPDGFGYQFASRTGWGASGDELRVEVYLRVLESHAPGADWGVAPLDPVIEFPPFDDRLRVEVVAATCLNLREEPTLDAAILACLPHGTVAETDDYNAWWWSDETGWMHLRADDGLEGWASAEHLRWHSDGVRLEE